MVIHLVTAENRLAYRGELVKLHRARKEVFVDELGWRLNVRDGLEYDEYDDERAMCVIGFGVDGEVAMSIRFRPTSDRAMLTDHFRHTLKNPDEIVTGDTVWEVTRGFCRELGRKRHNLMRKAACMISPLEVALNAGVTSIVGFSDLKIIAFFLNIGWKLEFLGDPVFYGEGDGIAYRVEVSEEAIAAMRSMWGLPRPAHVGFSPDMLNGTPPLEYAAALAQSRPELAQLMPQPETLVLPKRDPAQHYENYSSTRWMKAIARIQRNRQNINYEEGISS